VQVYVFTVRALTQSVRNLSGIVMDLGLNFLSGTFLGLVFYQQRYKGPLLSPFGIEVGSTFKCPELVYKFVCVCFVD
jgi:hypothetical protein